MQSNWSYQKLEALVALGIFLNYWVTLFTGNCNSWVFNDNMKLIIFPCNDINSINYTYCFRWVTLCTFCIRYLDVTHTAIALKPSAESWALKNQLLCRVCISTKTLASVLKVCYYLYLSILIIYTFYKTYLIQEF